MGANSAIQWTDDTLNFATGCTKVSPGCDNCYMYQGYPRLKAFGLPQYQQAPDRVWTTNATAIIGKLDHMKKPRKIFINSMSDTFHHDVAFEHVKLLLEKAIAHPHLTLQVLTKRPGRAVAFWRWLVEKHHWNEWPANVWLGTSVETQRYAPRIDVLRRVPAPYRFVSVEPMLGPLVLRKYFLWGDEGMGMTSEFDGPFDRAIDWVIIGGESGPGARPMQVQWARDLMLQCIQGGVPVFMKQLGAHPEVFGASARGEMGVKDPKGGDINEWPLDLQIREFPGGKA